MPAGDLQLTRGSAELLAVLRDGLPRTRAQLAEISGLSRSTVTARLEALSAAGLVAAAGGALSSGGRPAGFVAFQPAARILLAVDLGATHGVVALTDLAGSVIELESTRLTIGDGPKPVLDWVLAAADRLHERIERPLADLAAVGIGLPGPVEHSTGLPTNPPIMPGWDRFDVISYVRSRLDVPVFVDNDVNLLALGEHATVWKQEDNLLFVKVSTGIGAGIISGGKLQRGAQGSAGDLGHVRVPFSSRTPQHGDADADLEALASGPGIARALTVSGVPATSSRDVVALVAAQDARAAAAIRQAGRELGEVLATVVNVLNPSVIVLGGSIARAGEHLLAGVREVVFGQSTPLATRYLTITESKAGESGGVIGAATMLIQALLDP